jgi:hypothetical protein
MLILSEQDYRKAVLCHSAEFLGHKGGQRLGILGPTGERVIQARDKTEKADENERNTTGNDGSENALFASLETFDLWDVGQVQSHFWQMRCGIKRRFNGWKVRCWAAIIVQK